MEFWLEGLEKGDPVKGRAVLSGSIPYSYMTCVQDFFALQKALFGAQLLG